MKCIFYHFDNKIFTLSLFTLCLLSSPMFGQGWTLTTYGAGGVPGTNFGPPRNDIIHIPPFKDGLTYSVGLYPEAGNQVFQFHKITDQNEGTISGLNPAGNSSETTHFPVATLVVAADSVLILANKAPTNSPQETDLFLSRYYSSFSSTPSTLQWYQPVFESPDFPVVGASLNNTLDGNLIVLGSVATEVTTDGNINDVFLVKLDPAGNQLWMQTYPAAGSETAIQLLVLADGSFLILKNVQATVGQAESSIWLMKTDAVGNIEWETNVSSSSIEKSFDMTATEDEGVAIVATNENNHLFVLKTDENGNEIWRTDYENSTQRMTGTSIAEDLENHLVVAGQTSNLSNNELDPFIAKLAENGTPLWEKNYGKTQLEDAFNTIVVTPEGQYLAGGYRQPSPDSESFFSYTVKTDTLGVIKGGLLQGNIFHDLDLNCALDAGEMGLENWAVQAVNDTLEYYTTTDENGNYYLPVQAKNSDAENYLVSVVPPSNYWDICNNEVVITINYLDTISIDFAAQAIVECPFPEVQLNNSPFRPCEPADIYVQYCNNGTADIATGRVGIDLHEFLTYVDATVPFVGTNGAVHVFEFEDIAVNECVDFTISVTVDCDSTNIFDVLCMEVSIEPDTICAPPSANWSGALLQANFTCDNDEIQYNIQNVGNAAMAAPLDYIIIEDAVLLMQGDFNLNPQENVLPDALPLDGSIYHLIMQQEPGAPGPMWITVGADNCPNSNDSTFQQLLLYNGDPFTTIFCPQIVGPYDPNDKQASPAGLGEDHNILPNTDLQYKIRFQNVGNDTAFRVVIRDTLSQFLNPATLVPGPASHLYEWRLEDNGHLIFTFHNINLPDSTTNAAASQGFVTFKISQRENLEEGTVIENSAGIYFDFNEPIITNTAFHTIKYWLDIVDKTVTVSEPSIEVKIMPNPMNQGAWIELQGSENDQIMELTLYDVTGRKVKTALGKDGKIWLERDNLTSGMYFFTIENDGVWQASGKLLVN